MTKTRMESAMQESGMPCESGFTRYRPDDRDRSVDVGGNWNRFAMDNGAEDLVAGSVIGFSLHSFIAGKVTRMFVDAPRARVRLSGRLLQADGCGARIAATVRRRDSASR